MLKTINDFIKKGKVERIKNIEDIVTSVKTKDLIEKINKMCNSDSMQIRG